jgi:hypothetical protein
VAYPEIDLSRVKTYSVLKRKSKVEVKKLAKVLSGRATVQELLESLPRILKAQDFNYLIDRIVTARRREKSIVFMLGAHVIKCGLSPLIIDLMKKGYLNHLALNGAGAIHDLELAYWGKTSEEVELGLKTGKFGMAKETAVKFNSCSVLASNQKIGLGEALGVKLLSDRARYSRHSLLVSAYKLKIPTSVHVALGTDIVHQHPNFRADLTAQASFKDFKILAYSLKNLNKGGVVLNFGSAVILPEVFLKALSVSRNVYGRIEDFTTANFDMYQHYRPTVNVVQRPTAASGRGLNFVGHHEIMIPLLAAALKSRL